MTTITAAYANHPCFGMTSRKTVGRLHLPVAPRSNAKIKFAGGAKSASAPNAAMTPEEAVGWLERVLESKESVGIVGITGPGDPLAVPEPTIRTLRMVRDKFPQMELCLTTIGIGMDLYAPELAEIGVSHVTLLVDAVEPAVAEKLYAWIRPGRKTVVMSEAAEVLMEEQRNAVVALKKAGITVKINTTVFPGYNAGQWRRSPPPCPPSAPTSWPWFPSGPAKTKPNFRPGRTWNSWPLSVTGPPATSTSCPPGKSAARRWSA